jgi:uncharacterized repeat protein (TIGR01451 family)
MTALKRLKSKPAILAIFGLALVAAQEPGIGEWQTINTTFGEARHEGASARAGEAFYVMGGRESDAVRIYDPFDGNDGSWTAGATSPIQLHHFQAVEMDGLVYAIGAMTGPYPYEDPVDKVYIYDPLADRWIIGPAIPPDRLRGSSGTVVHDGLIYWISGNTLGHIGPVTAMVDVYDPATGIFTPLTEIPNPRDHFFATLHQGDIYVIGGRRTGEISAFEPTIPEIDVYDIAAAAWQTLPAGANLNPPRAAAATDRVGDEIIIAGGESGSQDMAHAEVQAFNPATGQWRNLADMLTPRHAAQAIVSNDGFYVAAGSPYRGGPGGAVLDTEALFLAGVTTPTGIPITAGTISAPASVVFDSASGLVPISHIGGNQAVIIMEIAIIGSTVFSLAEPLPDPVSLAPGTGRDIAVNFAGGVGTETAVLEITDSNNQITTVALETAPSEVQLALNIAAAPSPAIAGETLAYTLTVNNLSDTQAENVALAITLPSAATLLATDGCEQDPAGHPACTIGQIPANGSIEVVVSVDVLSSATGSLQFGASANADNEDEAVSGENTTPVAIVNDLNLAIAGDADPIDAETMTLMYMIIVTNAGPSDAVSAQVMTELSPGPDNVEWTCQADSTASCTGSGVGDIDDLADLPIGTSVTYQIEATASTALVKEGVSISAEAVPSGGATDPNPDNNSDSITIVTRLFHDRFEAIEE